MVEEAVIFFDYSETMPDRGTMREVCHRGDISFNESS